MGEIPKSESLTQLVVKVTQLSPVDERPLGKVCPTSRNQVTRRGFLQLFGASAAAGAITAASTGLTGTLFGVTEPILVTPNSSPDLSTHYIVERIPMKWGPAQMPQCFGPWTEVEGFHAPIFVMDGMDPHAAFYRAALDLRKQFFNLSLDLQVQGGKWGYLVTVSSSPICAIPSVTRDSGMDLFTEFEMHWVYDYYLEEFLQRYKVISTTGQYPIEVPTEIRMALLMRLDREILVDPRKVEKEFLRSWRPGGMTLTR